ncbi:hypothetical protein Nepgr_028013 [Nepenthes gracilis]|uniref:Transmembrane protein n=1 Tax=Nepenthes gracilis TaxID=150966 RepID=A0AAD3TAX9_NEPGR|nr:hypothetical protein Nepgr_028013 [Nepenthes gracilis]
MSTTSLPSVSDFVIVVSESKRIINSHARHFLVLSVLFLLPLSFSLAVFPTLLTTLSSNHPNRIETHFRSTSFPKSHDHHKISTKFLTLCLLFPVFTLVLCLSAVGSITYSVFHGFYGGPVKLIAAIKSLSSSFIPLLVTMIAAQLIVFVVVGLFGLFWYLGIKGIDLIGVQISYDSPYCVAFSLTVALVLGFVLMYLNVNWALVGVIVVLESKWAFKAMARSSSLIRGMRKVRLTLVMFFWVSAVLLLWMLMVSGKDSDVVDAEWKSWAFIVQIVGTSAILTLLLLHNTAANTVLYMYCKALHGELVGEIAEEFATAYASLSFDDDKTPPPVSVVAH